MTNRFKVGDVVKCVEKSTLGWPGEEGKIYTVTATIFGGKEISITANRSDWCKGARFELVKSADETAPATFLQRVQQLVQQISYKHGWSLLVQQEDTGKVFMQVSVDCFAEASMDSVKRDGSRVPWKGGKRYLSEHMCHQELVGIAFDLIKAAEMHEVHEWFRYKGASIFNPHLDPDVLVEVAKKASSFNVRKNAMSMAEG